MIPKVRKVLQQTLLEENRIGNFIRIYPTEGSNIYDKFFETPPKLNKIVYNFLFGREEFRSLSKSRALIVNPQPSVKYKIVNQDDSQLMKRVGSQSDKIIGKKSEDGQSEIVVKPGMTKSRDVVPETKFLQYVRILSLVNIVLSPETISSSSIRSD